MKLGKSVAITALATMFIIGAFADSADAARRRRRGKRFNKSKNTPALIFETFFELDDGTPITDNNADESIGVFLDAIDITGFSIQEEQLLNEGELFGNLDLGNANLSAELSDDEITYTIFTGNFLNPNAFLKFDPLALNNLPSEGDFVNDLEDILNSSEAGTFLVNENFTNAGSLGLAIENTLDFLTLDEAIDTAEDRGQDPDEAKADDLIIEAIGTESRTTVPEPTATLGMLALGALGLGVLRKHK